MGRSKLLQRRLTDAIQRLDDAYPGFATEFGKDKIVRDVNSIAAEADRFFEIFRDLAGKISTLASPEQERVNLSRLIDSEVRFADFYLDFKHDIKKNLLLDEHLPDIMGNAADYSLCMSAFINSARERLKSCQERELSISLSHDAKDVHIVMQDNGMAISEACRKVAAEADSTFNLDEIHDPDRIVCHAIYLLRQCGVLFSIDAKDGCNKISFTIPYR
jgi:hypothetical protein